MAPSPLTLSQGGELARFNSIPLSLRSADGTVRSELVFIFSQLLFLFVLTVPPPSLSSANGSVCSDSIASLSPSGSRICTYWLYYLNLCHQLVVVFMLTLSLLSLS